MTAPMKVRPLRSYTVPKYPSAADPNPLDETPGVPHATSREVLAALSALGIASTMGCGSQGGAPDSAGQNPFSTSSVTKRSFEYSENGSGRQAPPPPMFTSYGTGMFGTGSWLAPSRKSGNIERYRVEQALDAIMRDAGFEPEKRVAVEIDGVEFVARGFDAKHGIGYAFYHGDTGTIAIPKNATRSMEEQVLRIEAHTLGWWREGGYLPRWNSSDLETLESRVRELKAETDAEFLSFGEIVALEENGPSQGIYIMVLDTTNPRLSMLADKYPNSRVEEGIVDVLGRTAGADAAREAAEGMWERKDELTRKDVLARLEADVLQYIRWARSQGMQ